MLIFSSKCSGKNISSIDISVLIEQRYEVEVNTWIRNFCMIIFLTSTTASKHDHEETFFLSVVVIDLKVMPPLKSKTLLELTRRRSSDLIPFSCFLKPSFWLNTQWALRIFFLLVSLSLTFNILQLFFVPQYKWLQENKTSKEKRS